MKWNCPHCGMVLGLGDDKVNSGWSFSRCYKCGGHALIRKAEISVIKVDRAPPGERVLLPENAEAPQLGMGQNATQAFARVTASPTPVQVQSGVQPALNPQASALQAVAAQTAQLGIPAAQVAGVHARSAQATRARSLPIAMGMAATLAVASGTYLVVQGKNLYDRATQTAQNSAPQIVSVTTQQAAPTEAPSTVQGNSVAVSGHASEKAQELQPLPNGVMVRAKNASTPLHTGPGQAYPVVGNASTTSAFKVLEWKDRWFRVADAQTGNTAGWVKNDAVIQVEK